MGSYKWALEHKMEDENLLEDILLEFGFDKEEEDDEDDDETEYSIKVNDWKPLYLTPEIGKNKLVLTFHWMGDSTTEVYYDYLIHCGVLIGKLMIAMETMSNRS